VNSGKYIANFAAAGNQVAVKASLASDPLRKLTPAISELKVTAMDTGTYAPSGSVVTGTVHVTEPSAALILELHGKENGGSFAVSLTVNGTTVNGVKTTSGALIEPGDGGTQGTGGDDPLQTAAENLRQEISGKDLTAYYYKFTIPSQYTASPFSATLTFRLNPSADRLSTPSVYSYILLYNKLNYYPTGTFASGSTAVPSQPFTFDRVRLDAGGQMIPAGYGPEL